MPFPMSQLFPFVDNANARFLYHIPENFEQRHWSFSRIDSAVAIQLKGSGPLVVVADEVLDFVDQLYCEGGGIEVDIGIASFL